MAIQKKHSVLWQRLAALAAAALLLCVCSLYAGAAEAPVTHQEHRSIHTTVDGFQKNTEVDVSVAYQVGGTQIAARTRQSEELAGASRDVWSLYNVYESTAYDMTYTLSQPLRQAEQVTVHVPYDAASPTDETFFVFHVPAGTAVRILGQAYGLTAYRGKTIADVKAVIESQYAADEYCMDSLIDPEDDYSVWDDAEEQGDSVWYHLKKGYLYRVSISSGEDETSAPENIYFSVD